MKVPDKKNTKSLLNLFMKIYLGVLYLGKKMDRKYQIQIIEHLIT